MNRIRTVHLELLRHGPAHNQLLSPLTRYLGLCGNHTPATVTVPFEHEHFLGRLNTLRYGDSPKTRHIQVKDMAQRMAGVLAAMPGLIAELSDAPAAGETMTHLQLVLSASELALLPFELAYAPDGVPGAGQPLALQKQLPLCLTRQVRRVSSREISWRRPPRVLFVAASPPAAGKIPLEAHLQVLREAVDPWIPFYRREDRADRRAKLDPHLVLLPRASIESIEGLCRRESFTHIHILAHGVEILDGGDEGFGIALHDRRNPAEMDRVDGTRLAAALRTCQPAAGECLSSPLVVSLASCDSGQVGSVIGAGASVAHALSAAGIPLVVASQFPLTFDGSVVMVRTLYQRLFEGDDPRNILSDLRQQLKLQVPGSHDWASVVAYAVLPTDLADQLREVRLERAKSSIEAAIKWIEGAIYGPEDTDSATRQREIEAALDRLRRGKNRLERLLDDGDLDRSAGMRAEVVGLLGSAEKREAQLRFHAAAEDREADSRRSLERAMRHYRNGFEIDRSSHWNLVQYLSLAIVLGAEVDGLDDLLAFARLRSELDLGSRDLEAAAWAHGSLAEIHMLQMAAGAAEDEASERAVHHARQLARLADRPFPVYSTRRQFERYVEWFSEVSKNPDVERMQPVARAVLDAL